jgi:hypothetical protein
MSAKSLQVEVGALGPAFGHNLQQPVFDGDQFLDQPFERSWENRKRILIAADVETSLGDVIDEAAEELGVRIQPGPMSRRVPCITFYGGEQYSYLRTVDAYGQPGWALRWDDIRLGELIASADAGLVEGDPLRPLFWPVIPQGVFTDVGGAFLFMWAMWEHYLAARETSDIVRSMLRRLRRGRDAGSAPPGELNEAWANTFRRVNDFMAFLDQPRTIEEVSEQTGMSPTDAEGTLLALGFTEGGNTTWTPGGDPTAEILFRAVVDLKRETPASGAPDEADPRSDERIRAAEASRRGSDAP